MTVIVVDDNPAVRRTIREIVASAGATVVECSDGDEVLAAYERLRPDWVFMDIRMARVDGIAATRQLCARFPQARVAIVSDYDQPDLRAAARAAGAEEYVVKTDLLELLRLVEGAQRS